jgi:DNA polymerase sigma
MVLLKCFLRQRSYNESFTGGISSFLLFNLVYAYFQYFIKNKSFDEINHVSVSSEEEEETNSSSEGGGGEPQEKKIENNLTLGSFLLGFLKFYGEEV